MSFKVIDRFRPRLRAERQAALDAGRLQIRDEFEALDPQHLRPLALWSLVLLLGSLLIFGIFLFSRWNAQSSSLSLTPGTVLILLFLNILSYCLVLPLHEALHALAFLLWGGRPYFGAKLPLALYCGAKNQLFPRNYYLVVGLTPLVLITLAGLLLIIFVPSLAAYMLLALAGNTSGAVGDLWAVKRLLRLPPHILVEDTDAGYRAWELKRD